MSKALRNLLIIAGVLVIIGAIIAGTGFAMGGMRSISFSKDGPIVVGVDGKDMVEVNESYNKITALDVQMDLGELKLEEGDSFSLKGRYTFGLQSFEISESNGVLTVRAKQTSRIGIGYIGVGTFHDQLTFTYPKGTKLDKVSIYLALGGLSIKNLDTDYLDVTLDAGAFNGNKVTTAQLIAQLNLGSCDIRQLSVSDSAKLNLDAGSLTLSNATVSNLSVDNHLGGVDFSGKLVDTADFNLDMGSISLKLDNRESDLSYNVSSNLGSVTINGKSHGNSVINTNTSSTCTLDVSLSLGSADVKTR